MKIKNKPYFLLDKKFILKDVWELNWLARVCCY